MVLSNIDNEKVNIIFWEAIENLEWDKVRNVKKIRKVLKQFDPKFVEELEIFAIAKRTKLARHLLPFWVHKSADSFWDLSAHIVSMGKKKYDKIWDKPELMYTVKYKENFEYCFNLEEKSAEKQAIVPLGPPINQL